MTIEQGETKNRLPDPGAGFSWEVDPVPVLRADVGRTRAAFTTRIGGVSSGPYADLNLSFAVGDDEERVRTNRSIAGRTVGAGGRWAVVRQVHGAEVARAGSASAPPPADAQWTTGPGPTMAVLSADCVLLLLGGPERVGCVHAGWRGISAGVVENAVAATRAEEVRAGPAIGPCCFEVGPEVVRAFERRYPAAVIDERHVDLWVAAEAAARAAGAVAVRTARICTSCHPDLFFSHRRDRGRTGRQALLARVAAAEDGS